MIAAAVLMPIGWLGLMLLLATTVPTVGPRWLFFFLIALAATGTALPFLWLLHRRFDRREPAPPRTLLREALLFTLFSELCLWLQINRSLTLALGLLLAGGFIAIEAFVRLLERSASRGLR